MNDCMPVFKYLLSHEQSVPIVSGSVRRKEKGDIDLAALRCRYTLEITSII